VFGEGLLPGSDMATFFLCSHMEEIVKEMSSISFVRALIPFTNHLLPLLYYLHFLIASLCN
jgi:hypothetical protein